MSVRIDGEQNNQTIVFLPGLNMYAPYYFYKSFTEPLSENFKIITVEPFGYGVSDITEKKRTNENIIHELHTCLEKLGVDQYYLMAHSFSGIYSLAYANHDDYAKEVLGFIGLDNTPTQVDNNTTLFPPENERLTKNLKLVSKHHLWRFASEEFIANNTEVQLDSHYHYSEEDKKNIKIIFGYSFNNENIVDETNRRVENIRSVNNLNFTVPVIMFLSTFNQNGVTDKDDKKIWKEKHDKMIGYPEKSNVTVLSGSHLIYNDQKDVIIDDIKKWIQNLN